MEFGLSAYGLFFQFTEVVARLSFVYLFILFNVSICGISHAHVWRSEDNLGVWFSPSTQWIVGIECLVASTIYPLLSHAASPRLFGFE